MRGNGFVGNQKKIFPGQKPGNEQKGNPRGTNNNPKSRDDLSEIKNEDIKKFVKEVKGKKLSEYLTVDDINLPEGTAYKIAGIKNLMNTNQLRKFFEMIKQAEAHISSIKKCQEELIRILPHIAYSVGRNNCNSDFFYLMKACISEQTLSTKEDIQVFIDFITAIVAYHKFLKIELGEKKYDNH